jgi:hypothetical protein
MDGQTGQAAAKGSRCPLDGEIRQSASPISTGRLSARERDALNGTKTLQDVYAEREVIRLASNETEAAIAKLASQEEILAFSW